jgi:ankyrin repeat protein
LPKARVQGLTVDGTPGDWIDSSASDRQLITQFHLSAQFGDLKVMHFVVREMLGKKNADGLDTPMDLNVRDAEGRTAVFIAAESMKGQKAAAQIVTYLHRSGADICLTHDYEEGGETTVITPLFIASYHGQADVVSVIVEALPSADKQPLWRAIQSEKIDGKKIMQGDIFVPYEPFAHPSLDSRVEKNRMTTGKILGNQFTWPRVDCDAAEVATFPADVFELVSERWVRVTHP